MNSRAKYTFVALVVLAMIIEIASDKRTIGQLRKNISEREATIEDLKHDASNLDDQVEALQAELALNKTIVAFWMEKAEKDKASIAAWQDALKIENGNFGHTAALYKECMQTLATKQ